MKQNKKVPSESVLPASEVSVSLAEVGASVLEETLVVAGLVVLGDSVVKSPA